MAHRLVAPIVGTVAAALIAGALPSAAQAQSVTINAPGFSAGLELRTEAQAVDVGLPWYPGAVVQRDNAKDEGAVQLGLWGGLFGFKLAVLKLASSDSLETVSAYYRTALARHGKVLDCSEGSAARREPPAPDSRALRCDDALNGGTPAQRVYKVGSRNQFRLVALQPVAGGVHVQLLRIVASAE